MTESMISVKYRILVVGQTPPPTHGQALMIRLMLQGNYEHIKLYHVRMAFSRDISEVGRFRVRKIFHLLGLILKTVWFRFRYDIDILYYPPAGPMLLPIYRDIFFLLCTRGLFKKTIFHFRAAGISQHYDKLPGYLRYFFRKAYFFPDAAIQLTDLTPEDGKLFEAKKCYYVPNGLLDETIGFNRRDSSSQVVACILYIGTIRKSKGILDLIDAAGLLRDRGLSFRLEFIGRFFSNEFEKEVSDRIAMLQLGSYVQFLGEQNDDPKRYSLANSRVLCFPTYYSAESFGNVILEAMMFSKPVVATYWRSIPAIVQDGITGYIVPPRNPIQLADKLEILLRDPALSAKMGQAGRRVFEEKFTVQMFYRRMEQVFLEVAGGLNGSISR